MTFTESAAAHLIGVLESQDREAIRRAALALMEATARPDELHDDPALVALADRLAERSALWCYGLDGDGSFARPHDAQALENAVRSYEMARLAIAADELLDH